MTEPTFFDTQADFRRWLERNHATVPEIIIGMHKRASGKGGVTYKEALDEALCFGWIDGVAHRLDAGSYTQRFTPRRPRSIWSQINIKRVEELTALGLMQPSGMAAFEARDESRTNLYAGEQASAELSPEAQAVFRKDRAAWEYYEAQPPGYRKQSAWWVISAKKPETRERRLAKLIEDSGKGKRLDSLTSPRDRK